MAERRKNRKRKEQAEMMVADDKPSKDEYSVAKYLREKLPEKKTSLLGHKVDYFIASKAIDCLLDSPWAMKSRNKDPLFSNRDSVIYFMDRMLQHKFFHRAKKIIIQKETKTTKKEADEPATQSTKEKDKAKTKDKLKSSSEDQKEKTGSADGDKEKRKDAEATVGKDKIETMDDEKSSTKKTKSAKDEAKDGKSKEKTKTDNKKESENLEKKKEKKKLKLDMHMEQLFLDGSEVYVWIYDPIPVRTWFIGMLMVVGAVLVCLFPLWPQVIRHYIYYISVAAALFLVFIIGLAIIRLIVFIIIWALTFGRHHLWLLPNLTADVGFFESFWPLYEYEYKGAKKECKDKEKSKSKSAKEDDKEKNPSTAEKSDSSSDQEKKAEDQDDEEHSETGQDSEEDEEANKMNNGENGFEIVEKNEAEEEKSEKLKKTE